MKDGGDSYRSLKSDGHAEAVIKGSRFIAKASRVASREAFKALLEGEIARFPDATHHCWAFRIGIDRIEELSGDDGEPSGSAGLPIQRVLSGTGLSNTGCIVTRYFGGTKLGVGGLMRAYSQTASEAVRNAGIEERVITERLALSLPYEAFGEFSSNIERLGGAIVQTEFGVDVLLKFELPRAAIEEIADIAANLTHGNAEILKLD